MCSYEQPAAVETTSVAPERAVSLEALERELCELAAHIAAASCQWLLLLAEFDEREGWAQWGTRSCAHWLSWRCSMAPGAARERVRVARRLKDLPLVTAAFGAGELSYCKVRALSRVATPETEANLVEIARHATGAQLEKLVRGFNAAMRATVEAAQRNYERRFVRWSWDDDGSLLVQGRLTGEDGALLLQALQRGEETLRREDEAAAGVSEVASTRGADARAADALVAMARAELRAGQEERRGGDPCEIVVHVDAQTLASDAIEERAELREGPALSPETVRRLGCDAALVRIVERDGEPLSVARRTRTIPGALRRALRSRDGGCRFPGCTHRRFLHAHHIHHWARGGRTSLDNLVQLCSHHHRLVHEGGYAVERAGPRVLRFRRPDGRVIADAPPMAARGTSVAARNRGRGVHPDADSCRPRSAGDRLDYGLAVELLCAQALGSSP